MTCSSGKNAAASAIQFSSDETRGLAPASTPFDLSRRVFIHTALGTGFALATLPIAAQTVRHTDAEGLDSGPTTIPVGNYQMPAHYAKPQGKTGLPVILVISEIFGVHEYIADVTRRFAKLGYLAIAPELFARQGDAKSYTDIGQLVAQVISHVPDAQVMGDLDATVAWAAAQGGDLARLGVTGFCWGGRITWLYSAHQPKVKAGVAWYGKLQQAPRPLQPKQPIDVAASLQGPVLGLYGGDDEGIPLLTVEAMKEALAGGSAAAKASRFIVYKGAGHAFHADYRPTYRADAAADGWKQCIEWFQEHGVKTRRRA